MALTKVQLIDTSGAQAGIKSDVNAAITLLSCTAASPIVIHATAHGFQVGDLVRIASSGISGLDGVWKVSVTADADHFAVAFDNSAGGTTIAGTATSCMVYSSASAVPAAAGTQDTAVVITTIKGLAKWDELLIELTGGANATSLLTFDWVLQRALDPDGVKWEDLFYVSQANNTAIDELVVLPVETVRGTSPQETTGYGYKDTSTSVNGGSVTPNLITGKGNAGFWGNSIRLVIVPRAADMASTLAVQVLVRATGRT